MRNLVLLALTFFLLMGCKKDRLKDEKSLLIGKWEWQRTVREFNLCNPPIYYEVLSPDSENKTYGLEFEKKGKVYYLENNQIVQAYRLVFANFILVDNFSPTVYSFSIKLDNEDDNRLSGLVYESGDSLSVTQFPFISDNEGLCEVFKSTFFKVE